MSTCFQHPETEAVGFCRQCGKALCGDCKRDVQGMFYCEPCLAASVGGTPAGANAGDAPAPSAADDAGNPILAACLSIIPGLGAIYNSEYQKALVYILVFGGLIALADSGPFRNMEPLPQFLLVGFWFYMIMDSYKVAKAQTLGAPAPSQFDWEMPEWGNGKAAPIGPLILIGIGGIFFLNNVLPFHLHIGRFWPLLLIGFGAYMIWQRTGEGR